MTSPSTATARIAQVIRQLKLEGCEWSEITEAITEAVSQEADLGDMKATVQTDARGNMFFQPPSMNRAQRRAMR